MKYQAICPPDWFARSSIYQINPRTFSDEGTLTAVTAAIPQLAELGFSTLYLCPVFEEDTSDDRTFWSERQIKSETGNPKNPYRMNDYFRIDPEYGTMDDLRTLIDTAHRHGQRVLLDLVYLHIGPNAPILRQHPEFCHQDAQGKVVLGEWHFPLLDYTSSGLREYLWGNMVYYIGALDADGFRCDVGDHVPEDFWAEGRRRIQAIKPDAVLLDEGVKWKYLLRAFDANYCFQWHEKLYAVLCGNTEAHTLQAFYEEYMQKAPAGAMLLRDIDNHDTVTDWLARTEVAAGHDGMELALVLNYMMDGIPMVYCGNELGDTTTLSMFANRFYPGRFHATDRSVANEDYSLRRQTLIRRLNAFKKESDLLRYGETVWLTNTAPAQAVSFARKRDAEMLLFVGNLSQKPCTVSITGCTNGKRLFENGCKQITSDTLQLAPYGYAVIVPAAAQPLSSSKRRK